MSTTHTIEIANYTFSPKRLTIAVGDGVKWRNADQVRHSARRDESPAFNTGLIRPGQESTIVTFEAVSPADGLDYYCEPHPHMRGTIVVA